MKDTTGPLKNNRFFLFLKKRCTCELKEGRGVKDEKDIKGRDLPCNSKDLLQV